MSLFCHILIVCPSSGKSTLARAIAQESPHYQIISTDQIRAELFGDKTIQGNWSQVEAKVYQAIDQARKACFPVIYLDGPQIKVRQDILK